MNCWVFAQELVFVLRFFKFLSKVVGAITLQEKLAGLKRIKRLLDELICVVFINFDFAFGDEDTI